MIAGLFLLGWGATAVGLGVLIGRSIHLADCCPHDEAGEPIAVGDPAAGTAVDRVTATPPTRKATR